MFRFKLDNESGIALMIAIVIVFIGSMLAVSYTSVVIYETKHSLWQKNRAQSLFLAEAGIEKSLYYLNSTDASDNPWVDEEGQIQITSAEYTDELAEGHYEILVHSPLSRPWLPSNSYLVESTGITSQNSSGGDRQGVACIVRKLAGLPVPAAMAIMDDWDEEDELSNFNSSQWTIDGRDVDNPFGAGLPGIAVANLGDDIPGQLGVRLDQVTGSDEFGTPLVGADAILEDSSLPKNLDAYANYFERIAIDVSGRGTLPASLLGSGEEFQVLYANLSLGNIKIAGNDRGHGVLILDGTGEFEMAGNAEWNGVIICTKDSSILLKGGGSAPAHIYGALLLANGIVEMNGTADIVYSSDNISEVNSKLVLYQVYSWCGNWGQSLGEDYDPVSYEESPYDGTY